VFRVSDGVMRRRGRDEVGGDELGSLVDELVEGVLPVGPGGTPDDRLERRIMYQHCFIILGAKL
jgi:hypothetical protein